MSPRSLRLAGPFALCLLTASILGCQGSTPELPATPSAEAPLAPAPPQTPLAYSEQSGSSLAGLVELTINPAVEPPAASLSPIRLATAAGDTYAVDITNFLDLSPCGDCLQLTSIERIGPNNFRLGVAVRHPFELPTPPLAFFDRYDLHAFDVMGYLLSPGDGSPLDFGTAQVDEWSLTNAAGYSDLLDAATEPYFPTPAVSDHPYVMFFEDATQGNFDAGPNGFSDFTAPTGQNVMAQGSAFSESFFDIALDPSGASKPLAIAIGVAWGQSVNGPGPGMGHRQEPIYYLPEFHHKAAWRVGATITDNSLVAGTPSSSLELEIRVRDWQQGATVDGNWEWMTSNRDAISATSDIESIVISAPGIETLPVAVDPGTGTGTGVYEDRVFTATLFNSASAGQGDYFAWVQVNDSLSPGPTSVIDREINLGTVGDYHTGILVPIDVSSNPGLPPTADLDPNPVIVECDGQTVTLDASGSSDPEDGTNLTYEWDLNLVGGNPANFTVDVPSSTDPTYDATFNLPFPTHVAVRVFDSALQSAIAVSPVTLDVINPRPPVMIQAVQGTHTQRFNHNSEDGGGSLAVAGNWAFVGVSAHANASAGPTAEIRMFRSNDGLTWETLTPVNGNNAFGSLWEAYDVSAGEDGTVYVFHGVMNGPNFSTNWEMRLAASNNWGTGAWSTAMTHNVGTQPYRPYVYVDEQTPNNVLAMYAASAVGWRHFRSTNGTTGPFNMTSPFGQRMDALSMAEKPDGSYLLSAINSNIKRFEVRRSVDQGASWSQIGFFDFPAAMVNFQSHSGQMAMDPTDATGNTLAFGYHVYGIAGIWCARSTDGGVSWNPAHTQLTTTGTYGTTSAMFVDTIYDADGNVFLTWYNNNWPGDNRGFVAYSANDGASFSPDEILYNTTADPSWPGMHTMLLPDGCNTLTVHNRLRNYDAEVY